MPRRSILTARQRAALIDLPKDEARILYHYTLSDEDIEHINVRRRSENRFGYALQLCALRYPGRLLSSREVIPESVVRFIGAQLGMTGDEILPYAARRQTRQQHLHDLRQLYGFKMFSGPWPEPSGDAARSMPIADPTAPPPPSRPGTARAASPSSSLHRAGWERRAVSASAGLLAGVSKSNKPSRKWQVFHTFLETLLEPETL